MLSFPYLYGSGGGTPSEYTYTMSNDGKFQYPANVKIPNNVTSIQAANTLSFYQHTEIETVIWENGSTITTIPTNAFVGCSGLVSINFPDTITEVGANAFKNDTSLQNVSISSDCRISYNGYVFQRCTSLTNASANSILGTITSAGTGMFSGCTSLTDITVPSGLTTLGKSMFGNCTGLTHVYLPNTITSGTADTGVNQLFSGCTSLSDIELESGWNCNLVVSYPTLAGEVLKVMFESLYDLTGDTAKTLTLGATNFATAYSTTYIPEGETEVVPIATIAANKNWTLTE